MSFPYSINLLPDVAPTPIDRRNLVDWQDGSTIQTSRFINPLTKDYVVSSDNKLAGMNAIQQEVYLAVLTKFNSSSLTGFGNNILSIKMINQTNFSAQVSSMLNQCLSDLIGSGQITLNPGIVIQQPPSGSAPPGKVIIGFSYTDNVSGNTFNTNIPVE